MSEGDNNEQKETQKKVVDKSVREYEDRTEYTVTYSNGGSDTYVDSKIHLAASRLSRLADFIKNAQPGDVKPVNTYLRLSSYSNNRLVKKETEEVSSVLEALCQLD